MLYFFSWRGSYHRARIAVKVSGFALARDLFADAIRRVDVSGEEIARASLRERLRQGEGLDLGQATDNTFCIFGGLFGGGTGISAVGFRLGVSLL